MAVPHLSLDLSPGNQGRDRIHHHDINGTRTDERFGDFKRLLAGVGLGHQQGIHIHPEGFCVYRVEGVLDVDERGFAPHFLRLGHRVEGEGGFTRCLRAIDLHNPATGQATDAEGGVQGHGTGGDAIHIHPHVLTQAHHRAFSIILLDLGERRLQRFMLIIRLAILRLIRRFFLVFGHLFLCIMHNFIYYFFSFLVNHTFP